MPVLAIFYIMLPASTDNVLFDYMAWIGTQGGHYYSDVQEQNWPGMPLIHELGIRIFGVHFWTFRLTDFVLLQIGCLGVFLFLKRSEFSLAPYIFLLLYPPIYLTLGLWTSGERDIVATPLLFLCSALMLTNAYTGRGRAELFLAGFIIGIVVLIRPTFLTYLPLAIAVGFLRTRRTIQPLLNSITPPITILGGFLIAVVSALVWGGLAGNLNEWFDQTILYSLDVYYTPLDRLDMLKSLTVAIISAWHWPMFFAIVGFFVWALKRNSNLAILYVAAIGFTILLSYVVQRKGVFYHAAGLITAFIVLVAVLVDILVSESRSSTSSRSRFFYRIILTAVLAVVASGTASKLRMYSPIVAQILNGKIAPTEIPPDNLSVNEVAKFAKFIHENSNENDYILQWGLHFHIGFLAKRMSSTRFINHRALDLIPHVGSKFSPWIQEFADEIKQNKPKFIIVDRRYLKEDEVRAYPIEPPSEAFQHVLNLLSTGYVRALTGDSMILFTKT